MNAPFATALAGWKESGKNRLGWTLVPNAADVDSAESIRIAAGVLDSLGVSTRCDLGGAQGPWRAARAGGL